MSTNRQWIVKARPQGHLDDSVFELRDAPVPEPGDGEFLIQTLYLTISPPLRMWLSTGGLSGVPVPLGEVMRGGGLGRVVASNHPGFAEGDFVNGALGWQEYVVSDGVAKVPVEKLEQLEGLPISTRLHVLGASGATAYFGLYEIGAPKIGDVVVVSAAAGTVGAVVCQLAKQSGCTVIGIAGSDEKCGWLTGALGIDGAINYKTEDVGARLKALCPTGIDIYFDNVGGEILDAALDIIAHRGRVVLCGGTSQYDQDEEFRPPKNYFNLVYKEAKMQGFYIFGFKGRFNEAFRRLAPLYASGAMQYREDVLEGFENTPQALIRVLNGENFGTQLVRAAEQ